MSSEKIWLSSPTMHGEELLYMTRAYETNWMSTVGENIDAIEETVADFIGCAHAVALASGTAGIHLAVRLAAEKLYGRAPAGAGALRGEKVFCSDMTFAASANPIAYEGGEAVFIDVEAETWNMSPEALRRAFERYPEVRLVVLVHLYGTPAKIRELREICSAHQALLIEDAAESLGAVWEGRQTGSFGDVGVLSFNGNKIITGSAGGMLLTNDADIAAQARKLSTQSREAAPWYQHKQLGYNYRMSNVIAGVVRGQWGHLAEHVAAKTRVYRRYQAGLRGLPLKMNPFDAQNSVPNHWLSCAVIEPAFLCTQQLGPDSFRYENQSGKTCPMQIIEALARIRAEGRPIWKPMHMQPVYSRNPVVTADGPILEVDSSLSRDVFLRGLCLPSDIKMTDEQQDRIIDVIRGCFDA